MSVASLQVRDRVDPAGPRGRIETLVDAGTLQFSAPPDDSGVVSGRGRLRGRPVHVHASDPGRSGGALSVAGCTRIVDSIESAVRESSPVVAIWQSGGARLQDGYASLDAVGAIFAATVKASGRVPQISMVLGPAAGGAAYGAALTDVVVTAPAARMFITGPDIVRSVTGQEVDALSLGGPDVHSKRSGVVHVAARDEDGAYEAVRGIANLLGHPGGFRRPDDLSPVHELAGVMPDSPRRAYDVRPVIRMILDADTEPVELHKGWARNIVTTLGRLDRHAVGVVANNPLHLGGCLDAAAAEKAARFVRMCDAFGLPLVVLADVPGYLPGISQEHDGVIRRGAKLLHAFAEAAVPRVTIVTRKAYGGAFIAMNSRSLGATAVYAWPGAEVAVMSASAAVQVLRRREIAAAPEAERAEVIERFAAEHEQLSGGLAGAVEAGVVDDIIDPRDTRRMVASALAAAPPARGFHRNIPL